MLQSVNKYMLGDFMLKLTLHQKMRLKECVRRGIIKDIYKRGIITETQFRYIMGVNDDA